jgi:hypothetical protein
METQDFLSDGFEQSSYLEGFDVFWKHRKIQTRRPDSRYTAVGISACRCFAEDLGRKTKSIWIGILHDRKMCRTTAQQGAGLEALGRLSDLAEDISTRMLTD